MDALTNSDNVILITGAASGLGQAFFLHFLEARTPGVVAVGIDKQPWVPDERTSREAPATFHQVDITAPAADLKLWAEERLQAGRRPVSLVVHCAGVRGLVPAAERARPHDVAAAETLEVMDAATMMRAYEVNVVGTLQILAALLPGLRLAAGRRLRPRVVVMSSRMGSVGANVAGGGYAYRASKAALNAVVGSLAVDVPEVCFACVHPGRVATGLVKVREEGAIDCEESLRDVLALIGKLGEGELRSGCFVDRFGRKIEW